MNYFEKERVVRIRRKWKENRYPSGKGSYRHHRMELTIPTKFEDIVEAFLNRDLRVEARRVGDSLIIEAKPASKEAVSFCIA